MVECIICVHSHTEIDDNIWVKFSKYFYNELAEIDNDEIFINNSIDVLNWNASKVQEWLTKTQITQITQIYNVKFFNHGIDGMLLFESDSKELNTIGVKKIHQQRVLDIIARFAKRQFPSNGVCEKYIQKFTHNFKLEYMQFNMQFSV